MKVKSHGNVRLYFLKNFICYINSVIIRFIIEVKQIDMQIFLASKKEKRI